MKWIPRIDYTDASGAPQSLVLTLPTGEWRKPRKRYGGTHVASSRVRASYTIRRDYLLLTPLRFTEAEEEAVCAMVEALQDTGGAATIYPTGSGTSYTAYLEEPLNDFQPEPDPEGVPGDLILDVTWCRTTSDPWPMEFHG